MNEEALTEENQKSKPGGRYRESHRSQEFGFQFTVSEESLRTSQQSHSMRPELLIESGKWCG